MPCRPRRAGPGWLVAVRLGRGDPAPGLLEILAGLGRVAEPLVAHREEEPVPGHRGCQARGLVEAADRVLASPRAVEGRPQDTLIAPEEGDGALSPTDQGVRRVDRPRPRHAGVG